MKLICCIAFLALFSSCGQTNTEDKDRVPKTESKTVKAASEYTVITVEDPSLGWGYQILQDGKLAIDQKHIPAIQGYKGFSTKENAEITAKYIVNKMENGVFPPTLTLDELDSLGVL
jgi:hypothetical protein